MSKTVTREFTVYSFSELSEEVKERVRQDYLEWNRRPEDFQEMMESDLGVLFPISDLKVSFSVCYCQDDYMGIYGEFSLTDILNFLSSADFTENFTEKEIRFLKWTVSEYPQTIKLNGNNRKFRRYGIAWDSDLTSDMEYDLEYDNIQDIRYNTLEKMEKVMTEIFEKICRNFFEDAEKFFYEVDDSEIEEWAEDNGYCFTEDGEIFD